jgi:hypothetical protein
MRRPNPPLAYFLVAFLGAGGCSSSHPRHVPDGSFGPVADAGGDADADLSPSIVSFTATPAPTPFGQETTLEWQIVKPVGVALACRIHLDDDTSPDDVVIPDCPPDSVVVHR